MASPDQRFVIAFNGEVYNFLTLRRELEAKGERFTGQSDTEVVLQSLVREGEFGLSRFEGMFALALLDSRTDEILLARDRNGQKPLYFAEAQGGGWVFASEVSPLLGTPGVDRRVSPQGISHVLSFGFVPSPFSLRREIDSLLRGAAFACAPASPR